MKIIAIKGGLGNQMFQYAFAEALKDKYPEEDVFIDTTLFKGYQIHNGYELKKVFDVPIKEATKKEIKEVSRYIPNYKLSRVYRKVFGYGKTEYKEPRLFTYWQEAVDIKGNCYYEGSWQNERYFKDVSSRIRKVFEFKQPLEARNSDILIDIETTESVSIHVRRGDYLNDPTYQGICDLPYYRNAVEYIKSHVKEPFFYIFSNDADWCMEHIKPLCEKCVIIDWNGGEKSWADMQLMSLCKHNIIAHSSFSWWAAWLNQNEGKIVVAPKGWYNDKGITDTPQLPDWIMLENE